MPRESCLLRLVARTNLMLRDQRSRQWKTARAARVIKQLPVGTLYALSDIAISVIHLINMLHALDKLLFLARPFIDETQVIDDVLFRTVHLAKLICGR